MLFPELRKISHETTDFNNFNLSEIKRVLVIRLDEIGDVILTIPFLRELRRNLPNAWITLVVDKKSYNLVDLCPYINELLAFETRIVHSYKWRNKKELVLLADLYWYAFKYARQHFWQRKFNLTVLPRWDSDLYYASFLSYFSRAPYRVSYSENVSLSKKEINRNFDSLFTNIFLNSSVKHEVRYGLDLLQLLGGRIENQNLELWLDQSDEKFSDNLLKNNNTNNNSPLFAFGIGAGNKKREWPPERFIELGKWLYKTYNQARILLIGGTDDKCHAEKIKKNLGHIVINAVSRTTLRQTAALLKKSQIYVGSDSGPMHIMSAMKGKIVEISCHPKTGTPSHYNSPIRFGPWGTDCVVLQPQRGRNGCEEGCRHNEPHCILEISVSQVKKAIKKLLPTNHNSL